MGLLEKLFGKKAKTEDNSSQTSDNEVSKINAGEQSAQPLDFSRLLTSQLVAFWLDSKDEAYRKEYIRRIEMCGVSREKAEKLLSFESDILTKHPRPELLRRDFIALPLFNLAAPALEHPGGQRPGRPAERPAGGSPAAGGEVLHPQFLREKAGCVAGTPAPRIILPRPGKAEIAAQEQTICEEDER